MPQFNPLIPQAASSDSKQQSTIAIPDFLAEAINEHYLVLCVCAADGNTESDGIPSLMEVVTDLFKGNPDLLSSSGISMAIELRLLEAALSFLSEREMTPEVMFNMIKIIIGAPKILDVAACYMRDPNFQWVISDPKLAEGVSYARYLTEGASFLRESLLGRLEEHSQWMITGGVWTDLYDYDYKLPLIIDPLSKFKDVVAELKNS